MINKQLTASLEDYLEAIAELTAVDGHAHAKEIAVRLNVKMPSVTGALRQLDQMGIGWLKYGENVMRMTAGNVYIVPAGLTFSYNCEDGFSKMYFHLSVRQSCGYDIFHGLDQCIEIHDPKGIELVKSNK